MLPCDCNDRHPSQHPELCFHKRDPKGERKSTLFFEPKLSEQTVMLGVSLL